MDQFEAFQYFITNLFLHNVVLVALALLLGVVLGRLVFGNAKSVGDQLREELKGEEHRAKAAERDLEKLKGRHAEMLERMEEGAPVVSPEQEEELVELRAENVELRAENAELRAENAELEAKLAEFREGGSRAKREVEKMVSTIQRLEQRITDAEDAARKELELELETLRGENARLAGDLAEREESAGGGEEDLKKLVDENARLAGDLAEREESAGGGDEDLKKLVDENARLEEELVTARKQLESLGEAAKKVRRVKSLPTRRGSKADVEGLERRIEDAIKEREQVEKASAVLRKEMRGLRNKVKEIEQKDSREEGLEAALKEAEERLMRTQATVAKESRVRASLEKMVEDLEWKLADAGAERERLRDAVEDRHSQETEDPGSGASGAADTLRSAPAVEEDSEDELESQDGVVMTEKEDGQDGGEEDASSLVESDEDDLTRIKGVGVVLAKKLRAGGVTTFRQIANWTDEELEEFSRKHRLLNRAERGDWRGQARALCDGE